MNNVFYSLIVLFSASCSFGLDKELDFHTAKKLIDHHQVEGLIDSSFLLKSNAYDVVSDNGNYLFALNAWGDDFNGWIWSPDTHLNVIHMHFGRFYVRDVGERVGKWTKVYGK